jgi:hypothetical protein
MTAGAGVFSVAAGSAYCANGELIEHDGQVDIALSNAASGTVNLACVVYSEAASTPRTHVTSGLSLNTEVTRSSTIVVHTQTEYDALSQEDKDNRSAIAYITAQGSGVSLTGFITQQSAFPSAKTCALSGSQSITGTSIKSVSGFTGLTSFILRYDTSNPSSVVEFSIDGGSNYVGAVATSGQTEVTLTNSTNTLVVGLYEPALPTAATTTDTYTLSDVYTDQGARFSVEDALHRSLTGSGLPTESNPHGVSLEDFAGGTGQFNLPNLLQIGSGLLGSAAQALLPRLLIALRTESRTLIAHFDNTSGGGGYRADVRIYVTEHPAGEPTSSRALEITTNAKWDGTNWVMDDASATNPSRLTASVTGIDFQRGPASGPFAENAWVDKINVDATSTGISTLVSTLVLGGGMIGSAANAITSRLKMHSRPDARTLLFETLTTERGGVRLYLKTGPTSATLSTLELTSNASWSVITDRWVRDVSRDGTRVQFANGVDLDVHVHDSSGSAEWQDSTTTGSGAYGYWERNSAVNGFSLNYLGGNSSLTVTDVTCNDITAKGTDVTFDCDVANIPKANITTLPASSSASLGADVFLSSTAKAFGMIHIDQDGSPPNSTISIYDDRCQGVSSIGWNGSSIRVTLSDTYSWDDMPGSFISVSSYPVQFYHARVYGQYEWMCPFAWDIRWTSSSTLDISAWRGDMPTANLHSAGPRPAVQIDLTASDQMWNPNTYLYFVVIGNIDP